MVVVVVEMVMMMVEGDGGSGGDGDDGINEEQNSGCNANGLTELVPML